MSNRKMAVIVGLCSLILVFYMRVQDYGFVNYDDPAYVTANEHVQSGLTRDGIKWAFLRIRGDYTYWHPVTWLSHMLDCELFGMRPGPHHMVNVGFHALNAALLFLFLSQTTGAFWRSAIVAAFFAVHPLQVDTVAWITERKNVLSTMFLILSLWCYAAYGVGRNRRKLFYGLSLLLYGIGLMSKPMLVTMPFVMMLLDYWPLKRIQLSEDIHGFLNVSRSLVSQALKLSVEKVPFLLMGVGVGLVIVASHQAMGALNETDLSLLLRVENAFVSYLRYLGKTFWPTNLSVLYPHPTQWPLPLVFAAVIVFVGMSILTLRNIKAHPYGFVGWWWFAGTLVPTIGIIQAGIQAMADRFMYVPIIGLLMLLIWGTETVFWKCGNKWLPLKTGVPLAALGICAAVTAHQLTFWKDSASLFERASQVTKDNYRMHTYLGSELVRLGDYINGQAQATKALRINPNFLPARYLLATCAESLGSLDVAIGHFEVVVRSQDDNSGFVSESHAHLGAILTSKGRVKEGIEHYEAALKSNIRSPQVLNNLGWILATCSTDGVRNGIQAVGYAEEACKGTQYTNGFFVGTLAAAYAEAGRFAEAVQAAEKAEKLSKEAGYAELALKNQKLLTLYKLGQSYREPARVQ